MNVIGNRAIMFHHGSGVNNAIAPNSHPGIHYGLRENDRTAAHLALSGHHRRRMNQGSRTPPPLQPRGETARADLVVSNSHDKLDVVPGRINRAGTTEQTATKAGLIRAGVVHKPYALVAQCASCVENYFRVAARAPNNQFRHDRKFLFSNENWYFRGIRLERGLASGASVRPE
jgi:hypothetical protein